MTTDNVMRHRDYEAVVTFDDAAGLLHGKVINLHDEVTFQGTSVVELRQACRVHSGLRSPLRETGRTAGSTGFKNSY